MTNSSHVIRNFDPCMVFTVNSTDGGLLSLNTWSQM